MSVSVISQSAERLRVRDPQTLSMHTRDGVRLCSDVYQPDAPDEFPVLLMRQPYGRRIASTVCYAHPSWYAAHGYVVIIQDVRGRGTSEGEFRIFENEAADAADTIAWAATLPGTTGAVGMYGFSYQGTSQLLAAAQAPPALKALAPAMVGWDLRTDWAYENDAFCLQANLSWATQIGAETARLAGDRAAFADFYAASRALPFNTARPVLPDFIERWGRYTHYHDFLRRRDDVAYWRRLSPAMHVVDAAVPMLFIGGWFDTQFLGTLAAYKHFAAASKALVRLIIGPWPHIPWGRRLAGLDFGAAAASDIDVMQIQWFDHWLKGRATPLLNTPPVQLFEMGRNDWRWLSAWPRRTTALYLAGSGRAAVDERDGKLIEAAPKAEQIEVLVHDPWRPAPAVGGPSGTPPGPADRSAVDTRADVITFTTQPLEREVRLAGDVAALLWLACDAPSFDVCCTLSRVTRAGQILTLTHGYRHVGVGPPLEQAITIPMRATCANLASGEALRLSIAAACFPAYPVNHGTGGPIEAALEDARVITLMVRHGGARASSLRVSLADEGD
jgi:putative CocE/NonD family hydrolase